MYNTHSTAAPPFEPLHGINRPRSQGHGTSPHGLITPELSGPLLGRGRRGAAAMGRGLRTGVPAQAHALYQAVCQTWFHSTFHLAAGRMAKPGFWTPFLFVFALRYAKVARSLCSQGRCYSTLARCYVERRIFIRRGVIGHLQSGQNPLWYNKRCVILTR